MKMDGKKWWLKSKTVISSIIIALISILDIVLQSAHDLITDNLDYLKGAFSAKIISILLLFLAIYNIYTRLTANEKLVSKKTIQKEEIKEEIKQEIKNEEVNKEDENVNS